MNSVFRSEVHGCSDETFESIGYRAHLTSGYHSWKKSTNACFGIGIQANRTMCHNAQRIFDALGGAGSISSEQFLDKHGFLPLYKPFISPADYGVIVERTNSGLTNGTIHKIRRLEQYPLKRGRTFCRSCAIQERKNGPHTWWHRSAQIIGVEACPDCGEALTVACNRCSSLELTSFNLRLPNAECPTCNLNVAQSDGNTHIAQKYARFVRAALNGVIKYHPAETRIAAVLKKLNLDPRIHLRRDAAIALEEIVRTQCGSRLIENVGLQKNLHNRLVSYLVFADGVDDPFINLLIACSSFNYADDYENAVASIAQSDIDQFHIVKLATRKQARDYSIMRVVYGNAPWIVPLKLYVGDKSFNQLANKSPGLKEQLIHEEIQINREALLRYCTKMIRAAKNNPAIQFRSTLRIDNSSAYLQLSIQDPEWLARTLAEHWLRLEQLGVNRTKHRSGSRTNSASRTIRAEINALVNANPCP